MAFDFKKFRKDAQTFKAAYEAADCIQKSIGAKFISVSHEECIYEYTVVAAHFNPNGLVHGGALFTAMDSCQGAFMHFIVDEVYTYPVTGTATIRYEHPVTAGVVSIRSFLERREKRKYFVTSLASQANTIVAKLDEVWIAVSDKTMLG